MGKYLDLVRDTETSSESADEFGFASNKEPRREKGYELNELNELSPICIFCGKPVIRGTPGTGALAGDDLHMECLTKSNRLVETEGE